MKQIKVFDTTLRDGEQAPGCSMDLHEKLEIALALEKLGVDALEAGFAIASPGDFEAVRSVASLVKNCRVASLARAVKGDIDAAWEAVKEARAPRIHTFIATSPTHMEYKLRMKPEHVLETAGAMVAYAKHYCEDVEFSAEDATRSEPAFLARVVEVAVKAGATVINIPDTVGYTTPGEMAGLITYLREHAAGIEKAEISVHCHDDLGLAVANTLAAVEAGATQVECTVNGLGERAGNAALEEVVMALHTRRDHYGCDSGVNTTRIFPTSRLIYNVLGLVAPLNKAVVGRNAFAHESGIHQHGVLARRDTYEIMTPESVGLAQNRLVLGKHSGKHAVQNALKALGYEPDGTEMDRLFVRFKELADRKKHINRRDLEALVSHRKLEEPGRFRLDRFAVNSGNVVSSSAVVQLTAGTERKEEVAVGNGPIDAAFKAIDKIIPVRGHALEDYSIHTVSEGKDAQGEAVVRLRCDDLSVTGRGLSTDIVEASLLAYVSAMNRLLQGGERGEN